MTLGEAKEKLMKEQDRRKAQADKGRWSIDRYKPGDKVRVKSNVLSSRGISVKLAFKRDGPYEIHKEISHTSYDGVMIVTKV